MSIGMGRKRPIGIIRVATTALCMRSRSALTQVRDGVEQAIQRVARNATRSTGSRVRWSISTGSWGFRLSSRSGSHGCSGGGRVQGGLASLLERLELLLGTLQLSVQIAHGDLTVD